MRSEGLKTMHVRGFSVQWSIQKKLLLLLLMAWLPSCGIIIWSSLEHRRHEVQAAENNALLLVESLTDHQEQIAAGTEQMLSTLAQLPDVQRRDATACNQLFRELKQKRPFYSTISAVTPDGVMFAASNPFEPGSINILDRKHVRDAISTLDFSAGEFIIGRTSKVQSINFGYPVLDSNKRLISIAIAGLKLEEYSRFINKANLPDGTAVVIADHAGIRLFRSPENPATPPGKPIPEDVLRRVQGELDHGTYEMIVEDGINRIYAFKRLRLRKDSSPYLYVLVGIPKDDILRRANSDMVSSLFSLGIAILTAACLAWIYGNFTFVRPIACLVDATRRFGEGDTRTRTGLPHGSSEIGLLAESFDRMASQVEQRDMERTQTELALEESHARTSHLNDVLLSMTDVSRVIRTQKDPSDLLHGVCNSLVQTRGYVYVWIGQPEAGSRRVLQVAHSGPDSGFLQHTVVTWDDSPTGQGPAGTAIRERRSMIIDDITDPRVALWKEDLLANGAASVASVPLLDRGRLFGVLSVQADRREAFDAEEVDLLSSLATDVARALQNIEDEWARMQAEEALRESEERFRSVVKLTPVPMSLVNSHGVMTFQNDCYTHLFGYTPDDIPTISEWWQKAYPDENYRDLVVESWRAAADRAALEGGVIGPGEYRVTCKDGTERLVDITGIRIGDEVLACFVDLTERRRAEEMLRRWADAFTYCAHGIAMCIPASNTIAVCNPAFARMFSTTPEDIAGSPVLSIYAPSEHDLVHRSILEADRSGQSRYDTLMQRRDYSTFPVQMDLVSVRNPDGEVLYRVATSQDITERNRATNALRESLQEKTVLLKEVHHRVKNNLQIVASLLGLQAARATSREAVDVLQDMRSRVKSMALLHETLYRSGNMGRVNFESYTKDLCGQLLISYGPVARQVELEYGIARIGLPLEQVVPCGLIVNELVSNALKHGFAGKHSGRIFVGLDTLGERTLLLSVRDDGVGLPPDFNPFLSSTLGIQLVSRLAGQLGGQLEVERPQDGGASFSVIFPVPEGSLLGEES